METEESESHVTWVEEWGPGHRARCSCGWKSPAYHTARAPQDHIDLHKRDVRRINTKTGHARLETVYRYYREQEAREDIPELERLRWKALADEIGQRLSASTTPDEDQLGLW